MITIAYQSDIDDVDVSYPEHKKLPSEFIPELYRTIIAYGHDLVIETAHEAVANFVGCLIDKGIVAHTNVRVLVYDKEFKYDAEGILVNWEYGVLGSWDDDFYR